MTEYERITNEYNKFIYNKYYKKYGLKTWDDWFIWSKHKPKGATYKTYNEVEKNVRSTKGQGGSSDFPRRGESNNDKRGKYITKPYDLQNLFSFNYKNMINEDPNVKFNKLMNLVFNHTFDDRKKQEEQNQFIETYNEMKGDGRLEIINTIYQKLSNYIIKNKLHSENVFVDGSVICNIAIMISNYMKNGKINYDYDFLNNIEKYNDDYDNRFHLWLILQCFTSKNKYYKKYIGKKYFVRDWWAICHLRHRHSNKDMKTKGQCCEFKDINGKYIYKQY